MSNIFSRLLRRSRNKISVALLVIGDIIALVLAMAASLLLRFDNKPLALLYEKYISAHTASLTVSLILFVLVFAVFRLYMYAWRFASLQTARAVVIATTVGLFLSISVQALIDGFILPWSVLTIFWMTSILLIGGVRILLRLASLGRRYGKTTYSLIQRDLMPRRVVILGAGSSGALVVRALEEEKHRAYEVSGFLDDDTNKHGSYIGDFRVLGPLNKLYELLEKKAVDEVLIALPEARGDKIREYALACRKAGVCVKIIPNLHDVLNGQTQPKLEDISVEDLLRRPPVQINNAGVGAFIGGKSVLVTGAGGSIGSELCRQIIKRNPASLILLGHGENSIHKIYQELQNMHPQMSDRMKMVIASVADEKRINQVFQNLRPEIVFHAAAHKHVPIMEDNPVEALQNNVIGTACVAEACGRYGVGSMVAISTDKAVNPSSVMGATKWLCERIIQAMVPAYRDTNYVAVRFGNVLGSRGSVVPIFHEQIKRGGPVTVTHPEMTRYFMSIPEAVQLVLQAGALGRSGELFLLDMGNPVRIIDLAHDMIRLFGHEPDRDIKIEITEPRPGEKLHEVLINDDEFSQPAVCEGLTIVKSSTSFAASRAMEILRECRQLVNRGDDADVVEFLSRVVPGYESNVSVISNEPI